MLKFKLKRGIIVIFVILICTFPNLSIAEIKVYDNNNQYLGILIGMENEQGMTVFIPSINASYFFTKVEIENPDSCTPYRSLYFESNDCTGTPYTMGPFPVVVSFNCQTYVGHYMPDLKSAKQFAPKSILNGGSPTGNPICNELTSYPSYLFYEAKEVQLPFTIPISLPIRFENVTGTSDFYVIPVKKK